MSRALAVIGSAAWALAIGCGGSSVGPATGGGGGGAMDGGATDVAPEVATPMEAGSDERAAEVAVGDGGLVVAVLRPKFVTSARAACNFSSPMAITSQGQSQVLIATADGVFTAIDPATGADAWHVSLTAPTGFMPHLASTPVLVETNRLVFVWQDVLSDWTRLDQNVGVLDLDHRALDPQFAQLTLAASKPAASGAGAVNFVPSHTYSRSALAHARVPGHALGLVYASFGNVRDLQPFHGWVFEIDLDAWQAKGLAAAVTSSLVTSADVDCGANNGDGAREMKCGGGVWSHLGPQVVYDAQAPDGFQLLVPTGNGLLDLSRGDYANSLLRTGHGLAFDPACNAMMCDSFDPLSPSEACMTSCENLFMPRLLPNQSVPGGPGGACVGRTLLGCYAEVDWDLGANAPAVVNLPNGPTVAIQPGKDGSLYLIDLQHLGTLYDRLPITSTCGEGGSSCAADWAGTIVTRPEIVTLDGAVLALVPTFMPDGVHPAGLQAIEVSAEGASRPHLVPRWQAPRFGNPESVKAFRNHPGGVTVFKVGAEPFAAIVDTASPGKVGTLYVIRVRDGEIVQRVTLGGAGERYAAPLALDGVLYVSSCEHTAAPGFNEGPSHVEAFSIEAQ